MDVLPAPVLASSPRVEAFFVGGWESARRATGHPQGLPKTADEILGVDLHTPGDGPDLRAAGRRTP